MPLQSKEKKFKNKHGSFPAGTRVTFTMENDSIWGGDRIGILTYENKKWFIRTKNSGDIGIDGYLEAYNNTIRPI